MGNKDTPNKKKYAMQRRIEYERNLRRLEKLLLNGCTNQYELAATFDVAVPTIRRWTAKIEKDWLETDHPDAKLERTFRTRQLDNLIQTAVAAFERSRQDEESVTYHYEKCMVCNGKTEVRDPDDPGGKMPCEHCQATGHIEVATRKIKGQPGDPAFLNVIKSCIVEAARIKGLYPAGQANKSMKELIQNADDVGGEVSDTIEALYVKAPKEDLIKAMAMLDELKEKVRGNGNIEPDTLVIEQDTTDGTKPAG